MRILYHHRTLGDGAEGIHISAMVEAFRALGHHVKVVALMGQQTNVTNLRTRVLTSVKRCMPRLLYEGVELVYGLVAYNILSHLMAEWKPDLLYERYALFNLAGVSLARRRHLPLVVEVNAPLAYERRNYEQLALKRLARRCERFVCSQADLVVAVSTPLKEYLVDQGIPPGRVVILPNGTDPSVFKPDQRMHRVIRERLGIPGDAVIIGFVGILRPWHGVELLLQAAERIVTRHADTHFVIVGDGPSRRDNEEFVRERDLARNVTFTGRVAHSEIPHFLAAFDIGVSPRATFYASPMKVLEYMAAGLAVVAPRIRNICDVIREGLSGILFEPENVEDLVSTLSALKRDPERRRQLGEAAREAVMARHTWQHNATQVLRLVSQVGS